MLVLSRKIGEVVEVGQVRVKVLGVKGSRISLGFEDQGAERVRIKRGELPPLPRNKEENDPFVIPVVDC